MRTVVALTVTLAIGLILGPIASTDASLAEPIVASITPLQIESAISWFIAVGIGALIARRSFIGPSLFLSVSAWLAVTYLVYDIARVAGPVSFVEVAVEQWIGLALIGVAALGGAVLGRWFYMREIESVANAA